MYMRGSVAAAFALLSTSAATALAQPEQKCRFSLARPWRGIRECAPPPPPPSPPLLSLRGGSASIDRSTLIGMCLALLAATMNGVGLNLQRLGQRRHGPIINVCGVILSALCGPVDMLSYSFAAQSLLAPFGSFSLVINLLLASPLHGDAVAPRDLAATVHRTRDRLDRWPSGRAADAYFRRSLSAASPSASPTPTARAWRALTRNSSPSQRGPPLAPGSVASQLRSHSWRLASPTPAPGPRPSPDSATR